MAGTATAGVEPASAIRTAPHRDPLHPDQLGPDQLGAQGLLMAALHLDPVHPDRRERARSVLSVRSALQGSLNPQNPTASPANRRGPHRTTKTAPDPGDAGRTNRRPTRIDTTPILDAALGTDRGAILALARGGLPEIGMLGP